VRTKLSATGSRSCSTGRVCRSSPRSAVRACAQPDFAGALRLPAGACVTLRPITPSDADVLQAYVRGLSRLTEVIRQAAQSQIIVNSHRINHGVMPDLRKPEADNF
jgi:hypothetical protein